MDNYVFRNNCMNKVITILQRHCIYLAALLNVFAHNCIFLSEDKWSCFGKHVKSKSQAYISSLQALWTCVYTTSPHHRRVLGTR